jgi:hypothetical protein
MGPSCRTDADCNGGQTGTEIVCGAQGDCVVGCHSSTDCSPGDVCDSSVGDGICDNSEVVKISVGATARSFMAPASVQISGQGSDEIGKVQITSSVGTIDFQGASLSALTYEVQSLAGETLYQTLAVGSDSLAVFWIYCQAGEINYLYREDTSGVAVTYEEGTGTCSDDGKAVTVMISLPAFVLNPPPGLVPDVVMQGAGIAYDGGAPGFAELAGSRWTFFPFNTVDCATCGTPGWFEVHSLLWDASASQAGFGIFYMIDGDADSVQLSYSLILPTLASLDTTLPATWSHP